MTGGRCQTVGKTCAGVLGVLGLTVLLVFPGSALGGVTFVVDEDWNEALRARFVITNDTAAVLDNWVLTFDLPKNSIESIWDGKVLKKKQGTFVVKPGPWNKVLQPGESTEIGVIIKPGNMEGPPENLVLE